MRLNRFGIRARITGGSLLIAILISVVAGFIIHSQIVRIDYDGEVSVLASIAAPYKAALNDDPAAEARIRRAATRRRRWSTPKGSW